MTTMLAFAAFLALMPASALEPQTEDSVLVSYDLRAVMPRWDSSTSWSLSLIEPPLASPRKWEPERSLEYADLTAFELLDLVTQILGDELRREGRELMVEGNMLTVLAPESLQEQVRAVLDGLETALAGTIPVRIDVLDIPQGGGELPPTGLIGEEDAAKLVAAQVGRGAQHRSYSLELSAGRTAQLDAYKSIPFLYDYDVQIAQAIMVFQPQMSETHAGTRLVLRGHAVPGGLSLSMVFLHSNPLGKIEKRALKLRGLVNLPDKGPIQTLQGPDGVESPRVLAAGLAFDTFLPEGKALALTLEAELGDASTRQVVLVRRVGGTMTSYLVRPIPRTNRALIALNAELFRAGSLRTEAAPWFDENPSSRLLQPNAVAHFDGEPSGFLLAWLKARFNLWRRLGPWFLIVTDPAWDRDAAAQLDKLVKSLRPSTALQDVTVDLRAPGKAARPVRMRVPLRAGSNAGLVLARGQTAVTGFDVEVAQGAAGADPYISSAFEGLVLSLDLAATSLSISGLAQLLETPVGTLETGYDLFAPIERPEPLVLRFDERVELPSGRPGPVRVGSGSDRAEQAGLALEITVAPVQR